MPLGTNDMNSGDTNEMNVLSTSGMNAFNAGKVYALLLLWVISLTSYVSNLILL